MNQRNKILCAIFAITMVLSLVFYFAIKDQKLAYLVLFMGCITFFVTFALWDTPPKHKEFSNSDRLRATYRAMGGSPPSELWTPDLPTKGNKHKKK